MPIERIFKKECQNIKMLLAEEGGRAAVGEGAAMNEALPRCSAAEAERS
jgi:hypothetical protein